MGPSAGIDRVVLGYGRRPQWALLAGTLHPCL